MRWWGSYRRDVCHRPAADAVSQPTANCVRRTKEREAEEEEVGGKDFQVVPVQVVML